MNEKDIAQRIKDLRTAQHLTLEQVAHEVGVGKSTVRKWETGIIVNMRRDKIAPLAKVLHTTPEHLIGWDENFSSLPYNPVMHRIPILGTISAGLPLYAEQNIEGYTYTDLNGGEEYFALRVKGDSMNAAQINSGNILIVRKQNIVENGEIAVIMVDDEDAVVKRFYQNGDSVTLVPQSTNPQYLPQIYDLKKTKIKIIGKVMRNQIDF